MYTSKRSISTFSEADQKKMLKAANALEKPKVASASKSKIITIQLTDQFYISRHGVVGFVRGQNYHTLSQVIKVDFENFPAKDLFRPTTREVFDTIATAAGFTVETEDSRRTIVFTFSKESDSTTLFKELRADFAFKDDAVSNFPLQHEVSIRCQKEYAAMRLHQAAIDAERVGAIWTSITVS